MAENYGDLLAQRIALRIHAAVTSQTDLGKITADSRFEGMMVMVSDGTFWRYSAASTATAAANLVYMPADNPTAGRWLIVVDGSGAGGATTLAAMDFKNSVRAATTAALAANTRVGNVLTANANGVLAAVDGVTLIAGDRVLVKNEVTGANDGIYTVTSVGSVSTPWVLTRATDADATAKVGPGLLVYVEEGSTNGGKFFVQTATSVTLNTTALVFVPLPSPSAQFATKPVAAIAVANQATLTGLAQTIDGVALSSAGMRVYLANQTTPAQNGIWEVQSGAWTRPIDWATGSTPPLGTIITVAPGGTANWQKFGGQWMVTTTAVIDTGTVIAYPKVCKGQQALTSGTPSTATVSSLWVLSATTSVPQLTEMTNQANDTLKGVLTADGGTPGSGSLAITGAATNTDTIAWLITNW